MLDAGTGLTLLGARYYDAVVGAFISADPVLNPGNPAQFNAYDYAGDNPLTWSDPSGRDFWSDLAKNAGKALKAAGSWVSKHSAEIIGTVAGVVVGAVVTGACLAVTAGAGSVGCVILGGMAGGAVSGAVTSSIKVAQSGKPLTVQSFLGIAQDTLTGAVFGAAGGFLGGVGGVVLSKLGSSLATSLASGAVGSSIRTALADTVERVTQRLSPASLPTRGGTGDGYATEVIPGGRPDGQTVFAGHGTYSYGAGDVIVPEGTTLHVYAPFNATITQPEGLAIEQGASGAPQVVRSYLPGEAAPDYTLSAPRDLTIASGSTSVENATRLSSLLKPNMGDCHWAACTRVSG